jgi:hypothetical protein
MTQNADAALDDDMKAKAGINLYSPSRNVNVWVGSLQPLLAIIVPETITFELSEAPSFLMTDRVTDQSQFSDLRAVKLTA